MSLWFDIVRNFWFYFVCGGGGRFGEEIDIFDKNCSMVQFDICTLLVQRIAVPTRWKCINGHVSPTNAAYIRVLCNYEFIYNQGTLVPSMVQYMSTGYTHIPLGILILR